MRKRIVIAGFGDTGLLVAAHLGKGFDVVGISPKPCLVSGQELGARLTQPEVWKQDYLMPFRRYKQLDEVTTIQGLITAIDSKDSSVTVQLQDGHQQRERYDALVISTGVSNGFWRTNTLEDLDSINSNIERASAQLADAQTIAVVGGGATGVSASANLAQRYPNKAVHFFYSDSQPLPGYHPKVRNKLEQHLNDAGVHLHPEHRADIPANFCCDKLTSDPLVWSSDQQPFRADRVLWAVGQTRPHNDFIPAAMLNAEGFVKADDTLRVPGFSNVFTVGDIAASDPNRSSARNWGYRLVAHNLRAYLNGDEAAMKHFEAPRYRWGSILGVQDNGLRVFQADGSSFRFPRWSVKTLLFPLAVRKMIYRGVRKG